MVSDLKGVSWRQEGRHGFWVLALVGQPFLGSHPTSYPENTVGLDICSGSP